MTFCEGLTSYCTEACYNLKFDTSLQRNSGPKSLTQRSMPKSGIVRTGLLHLPQVGLPETPAVLRVLLEVASGSRSREARCLDELLEVAADDFCEGVAETPELTELDYRFLFLLSEHSPLCLLSAKIGRFSAERWQCLKAIPILKLYSSIFDRITLT